MAGPGGEARANARWAARGRWQAPSGVGSAGLRAGGGRSGVRGDPAPGPLGAVGGDRARTTAPIPGPPGFRAAAAPARTLALSSAAASTLFSDMVPGPGLAGSRGPGAEAEEPWTAEGGRGRNLARWRRRQQQRRPLGKLARCKRRQRRAGWGGGGSRAETRRAAAVRRAGGRVMRAVAGALRSRSLSLARRPRTSRAAADQPLPPPAREPAFKAALPDGRGFPGVGQAGAGRRREGRGMKEEVEEVGIGG